MNGKSLVWAENLIKYAAGRNTTKYCVKLKSYTRSKTVAQNTQHKSQIYWIFKKTLRINVNQSFNSIF